MNNNSTFQSYDDQVVRIEDITTDIKNRNILRRLKSNYVFGAESEYLWIVNQHDNETVEISGIATQIEMNTIILDNFSQFWLSAKIIVQIVALISACFGCRNPLGELVQ